MTKAEIIAACTELPLEDKAAVRLALTDLIQQEGAVLRFRRACTHTGPRREVRRGNRSVDVVCIACGAVVEYRE